MWIRCLLKIIFEGWFSYRYCIGRDIDPKSTLIGETWVSSKEYFCDCCGYFIGLVLAIFQRPCFYVWLELVDLRFIVINYLLNQILTEPILIFMALYICLYQSILKYPIISLSTVGYFIIKICMLRKITLATAFLIGRVFIVFILSKTAGILILSLIYGAIFLIILFSMLSSISIQLMG